MINLLLWLIIGGVIGWLASVVMRTDHQQGIVLNVVVGILGAIIGGWLLGPLFGGGPTSPEAFRLPSLLVAFLGAVVLLGVVNLIRRGVVR